MTEEQQVLLLIRGTIAGMPEADQARVKVAADAIRNIIASDKDHANLALALVGAERAAQQ